MADFNQADRYSVRLPLIMNGLKLLFYLVCIFSLCTFASAFVLMSHMIGIVEFRKFAERHLFVRSGSDYAAEESAPSQHCLNAKVCALSSFIVFHVNDQLRIIGDQPLGNVISVSVISVQSLRPDVYI